MSTRDHPDWWRPVGGQNSQDSTLERRSIIWNDGDPVAPAAPPSGRKGVKDYGKFFTRGCRGKIETSQIYCMRTAAGTLDLSFSPHPCLGPLYTLTVTPGAAWAWVIVDLREMWNYDSLFIWVSRCDADVSYGHDLLRPFDSHRSTDGGATWINTNHRPYYRVRYSGETPGDVPVSGIINTIKIPNTSSSFEYGVDNNPGDGTGVTLIDLDGAGYCDMIIFMVQAAGSSDDTMLEVYCDDAYAFGIDFDTLSGWGFVAATPGVSLLAFAADGVCVMIVTKIWEFRRNFQVRASNAFAVVAAAAYAYPTLLR